MKPLHQVLQASRQHKHLSVIALHQKTTVPLEVIEALEAGNYRHLPPPALVQGALRLLAEELDLEPDTLMALYRRDGLPQQTPDTPISSRRRLTWRNAVRFQLLSPRGLSTLAAGSILVLAVAGLSWQWWRLSQPPEISLIQPENNSLVTNPVRIQGKTQPENTVTVNTEVIALDLEGNFSTHLDLLPGDRTLVIEATDQRGRAQQVVLFVRVEEN